jgi:hypothetical protein
LACGGCSGWYAVVRDGHSFIGRGRGWRGLEFALGQFRVEGGGGIIEAVIVLGTELAGANGQAERGLVVYALVAESVDDGLLLDGVFALLLGLGGSTAWFVACQRSGRDRVSGCAVAAWSGEWFGLFGM